MRYAGGYNIPGAAGNLAMSIAANYTQPPYSADTQRDINFYNTLQQQLPGASFDPNQLNVQPNIQPGDPGYNPFYLEQDRDRFILNDPRSGVAQMPSKLYGNYPAPRGAIIKPPHIDSPYMDEQIRRGFVPMTPPIRRPGPQLPGFV